MADPPDAGKRRIVTLESGTDRDQLAAARRLTTPTFPPPLNRPRSVFATWWAAWTTRHTVAVAVAAPTLFAAYRSIAFAPDTLVWTVVIAAIALAAATTFASYLPGPLGAATRVRGGSPCAAAAGVFPVLAAMALSSAGPTFGGAVAGLALATMGLSQRISGSVSCPAPTRPAA